MAASDLPTAKERRRWLAEGSPQAGRAGRELLRAGRWGEALECLQAVDDQEGLGELAGQALMAGDLFTWRRTLDALGRDPSSDQLAELARRAEAVGKLAFAAQARALMAPDTGRKPS